MPALAYRRTIAILIAALAILFSALAPSISHALSSSSESSRDNLGWAQICSVNDRQAVSLAADAQQKQKDTQSQHMQHCPYCATHAGTFAMPPALPLLFAVIGGHDDFPSLYYRAPAPLFSWAAAQPRGPPATA